jgi:hypothetical protein
MGLFKKKSDPISERGRELKRQISDLEEEIRRFTELHSKFEASPAQTTAGHPTPPPEVSPSEGSFDTIARLTGPAPRLRSTAHPHGPTVVNPKPPEPSGRSASYEPIFEDVKQNPFRGSSPAGHEQFQELGIRRADLASTWQRLKNHFRGPVTSNPKLVNYLAAGSIQGLRPLRYERRVARNRFIVLVVVLVLILWGILALLLKR